MNLLSRRDECVEHNHLKSGISRWEDSTSLVSDHWFVHVRKSPHLHRNMYINLRLMKQMNLLVGTWLPGTVWSQFRLSAPVVVVVDGETLVGAAFGDCGRVAFGISAFLRFRASASCWSSTVPNLVQVSRRNWRRSSPNSLVHSSISSSEPSVCIRSLANACHSENR